MRNGNWKANGEAIKFSSTGRLLDGQHRLRACVKEQVPFTTLVIRGLEDEAMAARSGDEGIRRLAEGLRSALDMACIRNEGEQA